MGIQEDGDTERKETIPDRNERFPEEGDDSQWMEAIPERKETVPRGK